MPTSTERIGAEQRAGETREHRAEAEDEREQPADVDAERGDHRRVGAPARTSVPAGCARTSQPEQPAEREADGDDEHAIGR